MGNFILRCACEMFTEGNSYLEGIKTKIRNFIEDDVNISLYNIHGYPCENKPNEEKNIRISSYAYHSPTLKTQDEINFGGLEITQENMFVPNEDETGTVFYKNGLPLAVYDDTTNNIFLLWDASHDSSEELCCANANTFLESLYFFSNKFCGNGIFKKYDVEKEEKKDEPILIDHSLIRLDKKDELQNIEREIEESKNYITNLTGQLSTANYNLRKKQERRIGLITGTEKDKVEKIINNKILSVDIEDGVATVLTKDIFVTDFDYEKYNYYVGCDYKSERIRYSGKPLIEEGKKYGFYIGRFKIIIDFKRMFQGGSDDVVKFINLNNVREGYWGGGCAHPHVQRNGKACLGDLSEMFAFAIASFDISLIFGSCIQFLESANLDDSAGSTLPSWDMCEIRDGKYYVIGTDEEFVTYNSEIEKILF